MLYIKQVRIDSETSFGFFLFVTDSYLTSLVEILLHDREGYKMS